MKYFLLRPDAGSPQIDNGAYLDVLVSYNMDNICRASNSVDVQIEDWTPVDMGEVEATAA